MELLKVRLVNIRSFADVTIDLAPGVVRIAGENGAGKSTIVGGISFAFLGAESVESRRYVLTSGSHQASSAPSEAGASPEAPSAPAGATQHIDLDAGSKLLRRGQTWGLAAVTFKTPRATDRVFRVHRVLGKRPRPRGRTAAGTPATPDPLDTEDAALVALAPDGRVLEVIETTKRAIAGAVAQLLDLPEESFVHAFKRIVAAPQGKLLQAIFEDNKERRDIYWRILGVDRYASAAADATRMGRALEERHLRRVDRAVAAAEQEVKDLEDAPERAKALAAEVSEHEARVVAAARSTHEEARQRREAAAELVARARERQAEAKRLVAERAAVAREHDLARRALDDAEAAGRRLVDLAPEVARFAALHAEQPSRARALAAFEAARAALEQARRREQELRARDADDARRLADQLAQGVASEAALRRDVEELGRKHALAVREAQALAPEATSAVERRDSFARWLARFQAPLERLTAALSRRGDSERVELLAELARTAPPVESDGDEQLAARASEIADELARCTGEVAQAKARLDGIEDLAGKVGSGAICPFLVVSCPHPKGANLLETVRENATRERGALAVATRALEAAQAQQKVARAAQQRLDAGRTARVTWLARVSSAAPLAAAFVEAWDRDRDELARIAGELVAVAPAGAGVRDLGVAALVAGFAAGRGRQAPRGPIIGQARLFEAAGSPAPRAAHGSRLRGACPPAADTPPPPSREPFAAPAEWDRSSLERLVAAVRARANELMAALPRDLDKRLDDVAARLVHEASELQARSETATVRRAQLQGQLESAPARLTELATALDRLRAEQAALLERHRADAAARAADLAAREQAHAGLAHVPAEHERFVVALEAARKADTEANRLRGVAEQAVAARERVERAARRLGELAERALALGLQDLVPGSAGAGSALDGAGRAASSALASLDAALLAAEKALDAARKAEQAAEAALLDAERKLVVLRSQLEEASRRARLLGDRRERVRKLREARDHVAHACSVLRGGQGAGRLSGLLYKALSELPVRLAERRVREVSTHARRIYRAIAPHETWELLWDPRTYVLALGAPGMAPAQAVREGIAIDDMSGGQQMSAALALHLALVHTYARNCDVLFLDEPTTHLDAKRRRALAETLRSLRGRLAAHGSGEALVPLRQMFLISHDDAFEGLQDQVIHVIAGDAEHPSTVSDGLAVRAPAAPSAAASAPPAAAHAPSAEIESPAVATRRPRRSRKKAEPTSAPAPSERPA